MQRYLNIRELNIRELHLGEGRGKGPLDMHAGVQKWNVLNFTKSKVNFQKSIQKSLKTTFPYPFEYFPIHLP